MRKRNVEILFRLTRREAQELDKKVKKSGLSREAFLRAMIEGYQLHEKPGPVFYETMRQMSAIGNNLNQIAAFFNSGGLPSHVMCENINHAISCIFEMREQVAEMAGKNYGNLKAYRK